MNSEAFCLQREEGTGEDFGVKKLGRSAFLGKVAIIPIREQASA
jgi:hypothetical protein